MPVRGRQQEPTLRSIGSELREAKGIVSTLGPLVQGRVAESPAPKQEVRLGLQGQAVGEACSCFYEQIGSVGHADGIRFLEQPLRFETEGLRTRFGLRVHPMLVVSCRS